MINYLVATVLSAAPLLIGEITIRRLPRLGSVYFRKSIHILSAASVIAAYFIFGQTAMLIAAAICTLFLIIVRSIGFKWHGLNSNWQLVSFGEIGFAAGVLVAATLTESSSQFIYIMLVVGISDTLGWLLGTYIKSFRVSWSPKSIAGSVAVLVSSLVLGVIVLQPQYSLLYISVLALMATVAEFITHKGFDNLTIALVLAITLHLL